MWQDQGLGHSLKTIDAGFVLHRDFNTFHNKYMLSMKISTQSNKIIKETNEYIFSTKVSLLFQK